MATYPANGSNVDTWDAALYTWLSDTVFAADGSFKATSIPKFAGLELDQSAAQANVTFTSYRDVGVGASPTAIIAKAARGTVGTPSHMLNTNFAFINYIQTYNQGGAFATQAYWGCACTEDHTATSRGTEFVFYVTPIGNVNQSLRMRVDENGVQAVNGYVRADTAFNVNGTTVVNSSRVGLFTALGLGATPSGGTMLHVADDDNQDIAIFQQASNTSWSDPGFKFRRSRGTVASPSAVQDGDELGSMIWRAYDGTDWESAAQIHAEVDGTPSDGTDMPAMLVFSTTPDGTDAPVARLTIRADGGVEMASLPSGATQAGAGAAADELWVTSSHATLPDNVVMIGV